MIEWHHDGLDCDRKAHSGSPEERLACGGFPTLGDRADHMRQVLEQCWDNQPVHAVSRVSDFLADLMHYCDKNRVDFYEALLDAEEFFAHEMGHDAPVRPEPEPEVVATFPKSDVPVAPQPQTVKKTCDNCGKSYVVWGKHLRFNPTCLGAQ